MSTQWNRNGDRLHCYALVTHHPVFKFPNSIGPVPTAAEAGEAMDMLLVRYPDLRIRLDRLADTAEVTSLADEALDVRLRNSQWLLERLLLEPFNVVEAIEHSREELTAERLGLIAARVGCSPSEIVVLQGTTTADSKDPLWFVFRQYLQTEDAAKAETKVLWLRREREQKGLDTACVIATTLPLYYPAANPA